MSCINWDFIWKCKRVYAIKSQNGATYKQSEHLEKINIASNHRIFFQPQVVDNCHYNFQLPLRQIWIKGSD